MSLLLLSFTMFAAPSVQWDLETSQGYVSTIVEDDQGGMFCATAGGILRYHPDQGLLPPLLYPDDIPWFRLNDIITTDSTLWIATQGGGLAMRQDNSWTIYSSYEGIPGTGTVYCVHEAGGFIWAGSDGGLSRGTSEGFIQIDESATGGGFSADEVTDITSTAGNLYLATDEGVYSLDLSASPFNPASWTSYHDATVDLGLQDMLAVSDDSIFGFGSGGVAFMDNPDQWILLLDYSMFDDSVVTGLVKWEGELVASCGIVRRYTQDEEWVVLGQDFPDHTYASCISFACGRLWCGFGFLTANVHDTGQGLGYLEQDSWVSLDVPGMAAPSCYQITHDEGRLYLGSHQMGMMAFYPDSGWRAFNMYTINMPRALRTYVTSRSSSDGIWTSSYHWGLTWIGDGSTFQPEDDTTVTFVSDSLEGISPDVVQILSPLLNNQIVALEPQGSGLWIGQEAYWQSPDEPSGLMAVSGDPLSVDLVWAERTPMDGLAGKNIKTLFASGDDSLWIAFADGGGCQLLVHSGEPVDTSSDVWYPGHSQAYDTSWGLTAGQVLCFTRDTQGRILAGTSDGLFRWEGDGFAQITGVTGPVKAARRDRNGRIWCLGGSSIICLEDNEITEYNELNSPFIPTNRVENEFSTVDEESGAILFSSLSGLWIISPGDSAQVSSQPLFYPQPFLPETQELFLIWSGDHQPVTTRIFSLTGTYLGCVEADSWDQWVWDGRFHGEILASGVYFIIIESDSQSFLAKVAIVR